MDDQAEEREQRPTGPARSIRARIVPTIDTSEVPSFYSNFIQVTTSPYEFTVYFSRLSVPVVTQQPEAAVAEIRPQPIAAVSIPLNLARGFLEALDQQIQNWEATFRQPLPAEPKLGQDAPQPNPEQPPTTTGVDPQ